MGCRGVEFSDLLPAGMAGLERAIDRFDASKGFKFSTYAHWWIRQNVCRCVQVRPASALICFPTCNGWGQLHWCIGTCI